MEIQADPYFIDGSDVESKCAINWGYAVVGIAYRQI